jgi:hypothetical protein
MGMVKDFWASLPCASCARQQKRIHDYVVADKGTAKEALDELIKDWTKVFQDEGKISRRDLLPRGSAVREGLPWLIPLASPRKLLHQSDQIEP